MNIDWQCKPFINLSPNELYQALRLRSEIFVVEQNCVFLDADNIDQKCYHFFGWNDDALAAYTRLVPAGITYQQPSIGRVVTAAAYRGKKLGYELMERSIVKCKELFGEHDIKIGAQYHLKKFYASFGFKQVSNVYLEDGIEHIYMLLELNKTL